MVLTEFNKELYEQGLKEDAREEGLAEGREKGLLEGRAEGLKSAVFTAAVFVSDARAIFEAVRKNAIYRDVTLEQIEDILAKEKLIS